MQTACLTGFQKLALNHQNLRWSIYPRIILRRHHCTSGHQTTQPQREPYHFSHSVASQAKIRFDLHRGADAEIEPVICEQLSFKI